MTHDPSQNLQPTRPRVSFVLSVRTTVPLTYCIHYRVSSMYYVSLLFMMKILIFIVVYSSLSMLSQ